VPKGAAKSPEPETPEPTLFVPKRAAKPPSMPAGGAVAPDQATQIPEGTAEYKTAWVDMAQLLEMDTGLESVSTTLLRDTRIPHLVVHVPDRTWEVQFAKESMTVGRAEDNDIPIPDESVSHYHALIERHGDDYVIRDTHSRNGVWLGPQRVERHRLRDGDVLSLGRAKLIFKGAFTSDELTLIGAPRIDGKPARRPVVFVPGMMGSELWIGSERLWDRERSGDRAAHHPVAAIQRFG
jgi:hypothetical protein